jgi:hypothetical protein
MNYVSEWAKRKAKYGEVRSQGHDCELTELAHTTVVGTDRVILSRKCRHCPRRQAFELLPTDEARQLYARLKAAQEQQP